jgi:hypothetical protein
MLTKKVTNKQYVLVGIYILRVLIKRDVRENSPRFLGLEYKDHTAMSAWKWRFNSLRMRERNWFGEWVIDES